MIVIEMGQKFKRGKVEIVLLSALEALVLRRYFQGLFRICQKAIRGIWMQSLLRQKQSSTNDARTWKNGGLMDKVDLNVSLIKVNQAYRKEAPA